MLGDGIEVQHGRKQADVEIAELSFDERLALLVDAEWMDRQNKRLARHLRAHPAFAGIEKLRQGHKTKLRALYQRKKKRDLFDLSQALTSLAWIPIQAIRLKIFGLSQPRRVWWCRCCRCTGAFQSDAVGVGKLATRHAPGARINLGSNAMW